MRLSEDARAELMRELTHLSLALDDHSPLSPPRNRALQVKAAMDQALTYIDHLEARVKELEASNAKTYSAWLGANSSLDDASARVKELEELLKLLRYGVEAVLFDWVGKQTKRAPEPIEEWGPTCHGCGADEFRHDGFCSIECRDRFDFGMEIRAALQNGESR